MGDHRSCSESIHAVIQGPFSIDSCDSETWPRHLCRSLQKCLRFVPLARLERPSRLAFQNCALLSIDTTIHASSLDPNTSFERHIASVSPVIWSAMLSSAVTVLLARDDDHVKARALQMEDQARLSLLIRTTNGFIVVQFGIWSRQQTIIATAGWGRSGR